MDVSATATAARGRGYAWDGVLLYVPPALRNARHSHFPALLQVALEKPFCLTLDDGTHGHHEVAVMAPSLPHATDTQGHPFLDILVDPDDDLYRYLHPLLDGAPLRSLPLQGIAHLLPQAAALREEGVSAVQAHDFLLRLLRTLCPQPLERLPWDERTLRACAYMRSSIREAVPTVAQVAAHVGLSQSRLMHLFSEDLGLPMRQYLLWLRLRHALRLAGEGRTLTGIALGAGFYDHAHFNRTMRRMVEFAPSVLNASTVMIYGGSA
ncbi:helix-turn-helix transcriptional regulator [Solimonas sp. K1W22B-7]|uniref:helix-turn-helix transcriptional regulator n=1 Tax=Solimonas sp. K1W22B-7 TaxID=2303331 RepID=UPI001968AFE1|nr:AraC family transcriptional regulator [Solimonas sp. K1W22B-7]